MIVWTKGTEHTTLDLTEDEIRTAENAALGGMEEMRAAKLLREAVSARLTENEAKLAAALNRALDTLNKGTSRVPLTVGYDLDTDEVVLANPDTGIIRARRPFNHVDRAVADGLRKSNP